MKSKFKKKTMNMIDYQATMVFEPKANEMEIRFVYEKMKNNIENKTTI